MQQYPPNMNVGRATRWLERSTGLDLFSLAPRHWRVLWTLFRERELTPFGESLELDELNTTGIAETYLYNIARTGLVDRRGIRDPKDKRRIVEYRYTVSPAVARAIDEALDILAEDNANNYFFAENDYEHSMRLARSHRQTSMLRQRLVDLLQGRTSPRSGAAYWVQDLSVGELKAMLAVKEEKHWYGIALVPLSLNEMNEMDEMDEEAYMAHRYDLKSLLAAAVMMKLRREDQGC